MFWKNQPKCPVSRGQLIVVCGDFGRGPVEQWRAISHGDGTAHHLGAAKTDVFATNAGAYPGDLVEPIRFGVRVTRSHAVQAIKRTPSPAPWLSPET